MVAVVIPQRHEDIPQVTADIDVRQVRLEGNAVQGKVSLQKSPMSLLTGERLDFGKIVGSHINPGRNIHNRARDIAILKQQVGDDRLHPGGAGFVGRW